MKLALTRTATGKEDPELPLLQRISSLELPASEIAAQINALQSSSNRHNINCSKETVWIRPLRSNCCKETLLKDTNNKKRLASAKKHEQWILERGKSVLWSDESKFEIFGSNRRVFVRCRVGERMLFACVVPTVKHGGAVMVWGCFADDTVSDLFWIQGTLNQHGYHSILKRSTIPSSFRLVGL